MKGTVYLLIAFILVGCANKKKPIAKKNVSSRDQQIEVFLDSVGDLRTQPMVDKVAFEADSVFKNQQQMDTIISPSDLTLLKQAAFKGVIAVKTARRILKNNSISYDCTEKSIELTYKTGFIPVVYYPFDTNKNAFDEYAICIGDPNHCPNAALYFFKRNKIIALHDGNFRFGEEPKYYKDQDGRTVVYYVKWFCEGSGEWWNNFFFYKYNGNKLIPVLNELENGNVTMPVDRALWLESTIQTTNPLSIKMVYYDNFPDKNTDDFGPKIINDSTIVSYKWNEQLKIFEGDYKNSKITRAQVLSYYLPGDNLLFINSHYKTLKAALLDSTKRNRTLNYLRNVMNSSNKK